MRLKVAKGFLVFGLSLITVACSNIAFVPGLNSGGGGSPTPTSIALTPNPAPAMAAGGATQQLTATGTFKSGGTQNLTSVATWTSSNAAVATVSTTGLVTPLTPGTTNITAKDSVTSPPLAVTVNTPSLASVVVTPVGPGIGVGGTTQLTAMAYYTAGSPKDVTSTATWTSSSSTVATVGSNTGLVTGKAAGATTITATYSSISGSTALNVSATSYASNADIKGDYVFTIFNTDSRGPQYFLGHFVADGNGNITSGVMDYNIKGSASTTPATLTASTYSVMPDGRGTMTLKSSVLPAGSTGSITLRFYLSGLSYSAPTGKFIEFDGNGDAYGSFEPQDSTAPFTAPLASGNYIFRLTGIDTSNEPISRIGILANNTGLLTGSEDVNDYGVIDGGNGGTALTLSSGSIANFDANGRTTASLGLSTGSLNVAVYAVSSTKIYLISTDVTSAYEGSAEQQAPSTIFSKSDFSGAYGFLVDRPSLLNVSGISQGGYFAVGSVKCNGATVISGGVIDDVTGGPAQQITGGSCIVSTNGRTVVTIATSTGSVQFFYYLISVNGGVSDRAYVLETFDKSAGAGFADLESTPLAPFSGTYNFAGGDLATSTLAGMQLTAAYNGNLGGGVSGIGDLVVFPAGKTSGGTPESVPVTGTYATDTSGRTFVTLTQSTVVGSSTYVFYIVTADEILGAGSGPTLDSIVNLQ